MGILTAAIDNNMGISFNNRPCSTDLMVEADRKNLFSPDRLYFHIYRDISGFHLWDKVDTVVIYKWNRNYPADKHFKWPADQKFVLSSFSNFKGNSHDVITKEVYKRVI